MTLEERRAKYEWEGAPKGICVHCGCFYEESIRHMGKDVPAALGPITRHTFESATKGDDMTNPTDHPTA